MTRLLVDDGLRGKNSLLGADSNRSLIRVCDTRIIMPKLGDNVIHSSFAAYKVARVSGAIQAVGA